MSPTGGLGRVAGGADVPHVADILDAEGAVIGDAGHLAPFLVDGEKGRRQAEVGVNLLGVRQQLFGLGGILQVVVEVDQAAGLVLLDPVAGGVPGGDGGEAGELVRGDDEELADLFLGGHFLHLRGDGVGAVRAGRLDRDFTALAAQEDQAGAEGHGSDDGDENQPNNWICLSAPIGALRFIVHAWIFL